MNGAPHLKTIDTLRVFNLIDSLPLLHRDNCVCVCLPPIQNHLFRTHVQFKQYMLYTVALRVQSQFHSLFNPIGTNTVRGERKKVIAIVT